MAVELSKILARLSSTIGSVLRFGERIINSRRPYQCDKYLKVNSLGLFFDMAISFIRTENEMENRFVLTSYQPLLSVE